MNVRVLIDSLAVSARDGSPIVSTQGGCSSATSRFVRSRCCFYRNCWHPPHPSLIGFVVVFGVLDLATVPPTIALCRQIYGPDGAIVFGWVNAAHQVGAALVAFLGGVARDTFGSYDSVWIGAGALCVLAALISRVVTSSQPVSGASSPRRSGGVRCRVGTDRVPGDRPDIGVRVVKCAGQ